jgi:hypothetical protein
MQTAPPSNFAFDVLARVALIVLGLAAIASILWRLAGDPGLILAHAFASGLALVLLVGILLGVIGAITISRKPPAPRADRWKPEGSDALEPRRVESLAERRGYWQPRR